MEMMLLVPLALFVSDGRAQLTELRIEATVIETEPAESSVTLDDIFAAFAASKTDSTAFGAFLDETRPFGSWDKSGASLEIFEITTETGTSSSGEDMETVMASGLIGDDEIEFALYIDNGRFRSDVVVTEAQGYFREHLTFEMLTPVEPVQVRYFRRWNLH
jgi:hypothetical protein